MASFFLDTSALAKRYVNEVGSAWVFALTNPRSGNRIYLARITGVEVVAAIAHQQRAGYLPPFMASHLLSAFRWEWATEFRKVPVSLRVLQRAMELAEVHILRGCDAIQLAAALHVNRRRKGPMAFVSADVALNTAAAAEGLPVDDPNAHP